MKTGCPVNSSYSVIRIKRDLDLATEERRSSECDVGWVSRILIFFTALPKRALLFLDMQGF